MIYKYESAWQLISIDILLLCKMSFYSMIYKEVLDI